MNAAGAPFQSQAKLWLTAFVGFNLLQYGFTNVCPLGWILKKAGVPESKVACA